MIPLNEYLRKLIHLFNLTIPFGYMYIVPEKWMMVRILVGLSILFLLVDIMRHRVPIVKNIFGTFFGSMLRGHEKDGKLTGATWVMFGSVLTIMLFSKPVAIIALIFMSLGDTAAGLIGQRFGKHKIWDKSWEGFFAGLAVCIIIALNFKMLPFHVSMAGAITAMVIELLPIPLDDNFKIPLGAGAIMMMFMTPI
ncbi:MAG: SEC59/DGK1/VTE5 family protein [Candidatus Marinimicrobia bacterium]|jgi:dolichol kinase|nr:SEC59/DGK1/VTE5 family protein [Candidatus Neomarinimicrobiota bacterium]